MEMKTKCEQCGVELHTKEILDQLIKEGKPDILCEVICPNCDYSTQVLSKPYSELLKEEQTILPNKALEASNHIVEAMRLLSEYPTTRELACVKTKLQEAKMWLVEVNVGV